MHVNKDKYTYPPARLDREDSGTTALSEPAFVPFSRTFRYAFKDQIYKEKNAAEQVKWAAYQQ